MIRALQRGEAERDELQLWQRVLDALGASGARPAPPGRRRAAGGRCGCSCCPPAPSPRSVLPAATPGLETADQQRCTSTARRTCWSPAGPRRCRRWRSGSPRSRAACTRCPAGCRPTRGPTAAMCSSAWRASSARLAEGHAALQALDQRHALPCALGDAHRAAVGDAQRASARSRRAVLLDHRLVQRRRAATPCRGRSSSARRARCCTMPPRRAQASAPLLLRNPPWARPFEIFSRALGMPSSSEADPSAAAGHRGAADVRLHVRRRRPGPGHRRGGLVVPQALSRSRGC